MPSLMRRVFSGACANVPKAWVAIEQLIRLLDAADIPVCGGAFGLASEVIDMINAVQSSQAECLVLLDSVAQYAHTILDFSDAMQPEYIRIGQDLPAQLARKGIDAFLRDLARVIPIIKATSRQGIFQRAFLRQAIADDIKECGLQLRRSHETFKDGVMNTMVGMHRMALQSLPMNQLEDEMDQLRIVGATVVRHDELKDLRLVQLQDRSNATGFWNDVVEGEVANKRSLVKVYYKRSGGERAFLRDIERLGDCLFGLPRIRAYCLKASTPFIVLEAESIKPLREHLLDLANNLAVDVADQRIWNLIANLNTAANFVSTHCQDIRISSLSAALKDVRVDQDGRIAIAPDWSNDPKGFFECQYNATELTRNILKEILMGNHAFHRLSCISFTFGAASWEYMSREEVLKLPDTATATAHLCAHAGISVSPGQREKGAKEAYEAWTQCPCLNHGAAPPAPRQSKAPKLSTSANQALRLGLSSQEQSAVSDLIDLMGSDMFDRPNAESNAQRQKTLPPSVWALLLIADEAPTSTSSLLQLPRDTKGDAWQRLQKHCKSVSISCNRTAEVYDGEDHKPTWTCSVTVTGILYTGTGSTKADAYDDASRQAFTVVGLPIPDA